MKCKYDEDHDEILIMIIMMKAKLDKTELSQTELTQTEPGEGLPDRHGAIKGQGEGHVT